MKIPKIERAETSIVTRFKAALKSITAEVAVSPLPGEPAIRGPKGFTTGGVAAGLKKSGAPDLALIVSDRPAVTAAVTTQNLFCGAPVTVTKERLKKSALTRGIVVNAGCSNVATGDQGLADARTMAGAAAQAAGIPAGSMLVASTGVIGVLLPMEKITGALPALAAAIGADGWDDFAKAILTTDLVTKVSRRTFKVKDSDGKSETVTVLGVCKGSGMIQPNMATMLAFITTDYALEPAQARKLIRAASDKTLNCVTVDGDTSTSDMAILWANGTALKAGRKGTSAASDAQFEKALGEVMEELAKAIARDGEGATRLVTVEVAGAASDKAAHQVAMTIANSPLVKTAIFGNDPNWGRIAAAAGRAGVKFDPSLCEVRLQGVVLLKKGRPLGFDRAAMIEAMKGKDVVLRFGMGAGSGKARVWTCDMTYDYIRINAEYTT